jgi:hypothetical protein
LNFIVQKSVKKFGILVLAALIFGSANLASASPLPLNNLNYQDNPRVLYNISPQLFKKLIDQVVIAFSPIVRMHGAELKANYLWNDSTVNAYANRNGNVWYINMFGGLARRKEITPDGFSMVICHELGHHLAGYPFKGGPNEYANPWAAAEGQSDYFATQTCAHVIWGNDFAENAKHRYTVDPIAKQMCDRNWSYQTQRDLCYRTADAGQSLANLLNVLEDANRPVRYQNAKSTLLVAYTDTSHPAAQCRLETYLNGAICRRPLDIRVIPGSGPHFSGGSPLEEEKEAANYSCGERGSAYDGSRPRCWFKPLLANW